MAGFICYTRVGCGGRVENRRKNTSRNALYLAPGYVHLQGGLSSLLKEPQRPSQPCTRDDQTEFLRLWGGNAWPDGMAGPGMDPGVLRPQLIPCQTWLLGLLSRFRGQGPGEVLSSCLWLICLGKGCSHPLSRRHNWGGQYDPDALVPSRRSLGLHLGHASQEAAPASWHWA